MLDGVCKSGWLVVPLLVSMACGGRVVGGTGSESDGAIGGGAAAAVSLEVILSHADYGPSQTGSWAHAVVWGGPRDFRWKTVVGPCVTQDLEIATLGPELMPIDLGGVDVEAPTTSYPLRFADEHYRGPTPFVESPWYDGDVLRVRGEGSARLSPFSIELRAATVVRVRSPAVSKEPTPFSLGSDFVVTWTPPEQGIDVLLYSSDYEKGSAHGYSRTRSVGCHADGGVYGVPAELVRWVFDPEWGAKERLWTVRASTQRRISLPRSEVVVSSTTPAVGSDGQYLFQAKELELW